MDFPNPPGLLRQYPRQFLPHLRFNHWFESFGPGQDEKDHETVEVIFSAVPEGTKVVLTHSGWEKLGSKAQKARDEYNEGWQVVFVLAYSEYVGRSTDAHQQK